MGIDIWRVITGEKFCIYSTIKLFIVDANFVAVVDEVIAAESIICEGYNCGSSKGGKYWYPVCRQKCPLYDNYVCGFMWICVTWSMFCVQFIWNSTSFAFFVPLTDCRTPTTCYAELICLWMICLTLLYACVLIHWVNFLLEHWVGCCHDNYCKNQLLQKV